MTKPAPAAKPPAPAPGTGLLAGWLEVFRAGTHTDSKGRKATFSQADLQQMADNHALGAAPAVLGHPKANDPAYAWVDGYKVDGSSLYAKFGQINPAFAAGVDSGAYRNRSLAVYQDPDKGWRVRHVGWLGAVPPAIDGLNPEPVEFATPESDEACFEFAAPGYSLVWGLENLAKLVRGLREQMIAKEGIEAADAVLPQWQIDSALEAAATARQEFQDEREKTRTPSLYSLPPTGGDMAFTQEQLDAAADKARKDAEEKARLEFAAQGAELILLRGQRQAERIGGLVAGWLAEGKVLPAEQVGLSEFMTALESGTVAEFTFAAADKSEVKKTPAQWFADFMAARKPLVKLNVRTTDDPTDVLDKNDSVAIAKAAQEFQAAEEKAGRVIPIEAAVSHVMTRS